MILSRMVTLPHRPPEELHDRADALQGVVELGMRCPSEAELERIAGLLGVEVQTDSGARVAQRQFGPLRVFAVMSTMGGRP